MMERRFGHLIERLFILILAFTSFQIASAVATGASSGNRTSGIPNGYYCTDNKNWRGYGVRNQDCKSAIELLNKVDVVFHGDTDFEFLSPKAKERLPDSMRTPRKYTVGKCTLAIVMLNAFPEGILPGVEKSYYPSRDVASFLELYIIATQIYEYCLPSKAQPGWAVSGGRDALGVFIWGTNSVIDIFVGPGVSSLSESINSTTLPAVATNSNFNLSLSAERR